MNKKNIIAVLLAGGEGKRFWPITTGKSVISFFGKPVIGHIIESLRIAGFSDVVIVTSPEDDPIIRTFDIPGIRLHIVIQEKPAGMSDAVLSAKNTIGAQPCLFLSPVDMVDDALFEGLLKEMNDSDALIVGKRVTSYFPGGYLKVDNDRLVTIIEKPGEGHEPSDIIDLVFHYFPDPTEFFKTLAATNSGVDDVYEKALASYSAGHSVKVIVYNGPWQSLKYPWHMLPMMELLLSRLESHKGKNVQIKSNVIIEGPVYIEDDVKIFENSKIVGPCYIGNNVIIGNNCIVRQSHIGADSVIGFNSDITRSYIGNDCWFHSNYIGDSVLEGNISMGAGAVLANLRLDDGEISSVVQTKKYPTGRNKLGAMIGSGVRIGVNASIMPGVKIGKDSFIGSGVVLDRDLPENSFCSAKPGFTICKNIIKGSASRDGFKNKI